MKMSAKALTALLGREPIIGEEINLNKLMSATTMQVTKTEGDDVTVAFVALNGEVHEAIFKARELKKSTPAN